MANKLIITFIEKPLINNEISLSINVFGSTLVCFETFRPARTIPNTAQITGVLALQARAFGIAFELDYGDYFDVTYPAFLQANSFIVTIQPKAGVNIFDYGIVSGGDFATFEIETFTKIILSRSPYSVSIKPIGDFDSASMDLRIWTGDITSDRPLLPTYSLSKLVVIAGQDQIIFGIDKIVNDFVKASITEFGITGAFTSSMFQSVWVEADVSAYFMGEVIGNEVNNYLAVDGFGYHVQGSNPEIVSNVLGSLKSRIIYEGISSPLYFLTKNLESITINGVDVGFTYNQNKSNELIGYINPLGYLGLSGLISVSLGYNTGSGINYNNISYTVKSECLYTIVNCIFKNKFGFWQNIPFNKISKNNLQVQRNNYQAVISSYGQYSLSSHVKKTFGITGVEKITCNTDYLPEEYNQLLDELFFSEFVYLEIDGQTLPVNLVPESIQKKTKLVDKLIQYSLEFEYSFNKMNTVI